MESDPRRAQFQRGFLAKLELAKSYSSGLDEVSQLRAHPLLAAVEDLIPNDTHGPSYASLVTSAAMKSLRRIEVYDTATIEALEQTPHPLSHVACPRLKRGSGNYIKTLGGRVFPACRARDSITSIGVQLDGFNALVTSKLLDRLTSVTIGDNNLGNILDEHERLPAHVTLIAKRYAALEECVSLRVAWLGELALYREGKQRIGRAWGEWPIDAVVEAYDRLPRLDRLILQGGTDDDVKRLRKKTKYLDIVIEPAPIRSGYVMIGR